MNNFLNNPEMLQKALIAGILGQIMNAAAGQQNGHMAPKQGHRCNLNLEEHLKYADALVSAGIIDKNTGESIKRNMTATFQAEQGSSAFRGADSAINQTSGGYIAAQNPVGQDSTAQFADSEFLKARECLLNYLQNLDYELTYDDLAKIESVVLELEKLAIQRNQAEEGANLLDKLNNSNELAKERLMTGSLTGGGAKNPPGKTFTREEVAKMSTAEFIKNEPVINYQLQNGLL